MGATNRQVGHLFRAGLAAGLPDRTDGELLTRFVRSHDGRAFEQLMARHGPMVWGVCRRALGDPADAEDAEDAFQATFLVLVRKGGTVSSPNRVGNWLYGVAVRAAGKVRAARARRREHEARAATAAPIAYTPPDVESVELLDRELMQLPAGYREAVVLCELEGLTVAEAAARLGCPAGTVGSRLSRGRTMLADRLRRCGVVAGVAASATGAVPPAVAKAARDAALGLVPASAPATAAAEQVIQAMDARKLVGPLAGVVAVAAGIGIGLATFTPAPPATRQPTTQPVGSPAETAAAPRARPEFRVVPVRDIDTDEHHRPTFPQLQFIGRFEEARRQQLDPLGEQGWQVVAATPAAWAFQRLQDSPRWESAVWVRFPDSPLTGQADAEEATRTLVENGERGWELMCVIPPPPSQPLRPNEVRGPEAQLGNVAYYRRTLPRREKYDPTSFRLLPFDQLSRPAGGGQVSAPDLAAAFAATVEANLNALGADGWEVRFATRQGWLFTRAAEAPRWTYRVAADVAGSPLTGVDRGAEFLKELHDRSADGWELCAAFPADLKATQRVVARKARGQAVPPTLDAAGNVEVYKQRVGASVGGEAAPSAAPSVPARSELLGTWTVVSEELDGVPEAAEPGVEVRVTLDAEAYTVARGEAVTRLSYTLDAGRQPGCIDVGASPHRTRGVFDADGKTLRLCFPTDSAADRPDEVRSRKGTRLMVLERDSR